MSEKNPTGNATKDCRDTLSDKSGGRERREQERRENAKFLETFVPPPQPAGGYLD